MHRHAYRNALIVTEGVFSMDGDLAPLPALSELARRHDAWLMTDDAHGIGVLGHGSGSAVHAGAGVLIDLQMGTLSKALASYGGYVCADAPVIDLIKTRARTLVYSTGLPPSVLASAAAALDLIESDTELSSRPLANAQLFTEVLGFPLAQSPIVSVVLGSETAALEASLALEKEGFLVVAIRPPTVPEGTSRLRFAFTANHPEAEVRRAARVVRQRLGSTR